MRPIAFSKKRRTCPTAKRNIGQLWAEKSGGKGLFLMAEKRDAQGRDTRAQILALAGH